MKIFTAIQELLPSAKFGIEDNDYNKIDWYDSRPKPTLEQIETKIAELKAKEPARILRLQRDRLLAESDWRDLPSYPGSNQEAWRTYRQALRDLPSDTEDTSNPTWPTAPETD